MPCIFIARRFQLFLPSSTRVELERIIPANLPWYILVIVCPIIFHVHEVWQTHLLSAVMRYSYFVRTAVSNLVDHVQCVLCYITENPFFYSGVYTRQHPAHRVSVMILHPRVSVMILHPREMQALWSLNYGTKDTYIYASVVIILDNAMPCTSQQTKL